MFLAGLAPALHAQETGKRLALIIGNDAYPISPLKNAVNDARVMDKALRSAGFQTVTLENARKADMDRAIGEFLDKLGPDDTALFFFAGHGVQIGNENFLVPVDFPSVATISAAKFACMSVARIFDELKRKRAKRNIVILDACRSNPVAAKYSLEAGLANPQDAPKNRFRLLHRSRPDRHGQPKRPQQLVHRGACRLYLAIRADRGNQRAVYAHKRRVSEATEGRQTPWTTSSLTTRFYFHLPPTGDSDSDPPWPKSGWSSPWSGSGGKSGLRPSIWSTRFCKGDPAEPWKRWPKINCHT